MLLLSRSLFSRVLFSRVLFSGVLFISVILANVSPARAALPVPERPAVAASGFLVSSNSMELETGARWMEGFSAPTRISYGAGRSFEPRFHIDMAGIDGGDPDMLLEGKIGLLQQSDIGLALMPYTSLPAYDGDIWEGGALVLVSAHLKQADLTFNTGLELEGRGGDAIGLAGVPLVLSAGTPITSGLSIFGETATRIQGGLRDWIFDAGARLRVTSILLVDAGVG